MIAALKGDPKEIAAFLLEMEGRRFGGHARLKFR
jgi:hypothetical protein